MPALWSQDGGRLVIRAAVHVLMILSFGLLAVPLAAAAQAPAKVPRIGYLSSPSPTDLPYLREAFRQGLRQLGYVEGQNVAIEYRYGEGSVDRFSRFAVELVELKVDIIVAVSAAAARAAKQATATIPIVIVATGDPVGTGLVGSLARPGGNVTGASFDATPEVNATLVELLIEAVAKVSGVRVLCNPTNPFLASYWEETQAAARALGVRVQSLEVRDPTQFERAFAAMTWDRADGLIVLTDAFTNFHRAQIVGLAAKNRLPLARGRISFVRKVDARGRIELPGLVYFVGKRLTGRYVTATLFPHRQEVVVKQGGRIRKRFPFPIAEPVVDSLLPPPRARI